MIAGLRHNSIRPARAPGTPLCCVMLLSFVTLAGAQEPTPQQYNMPAQESAGPAAPAGAAPAAAPSAGLPTPPEVIGALGRLLNQSISNVGAAANAGVKGAGETIGATSSAAGDLARGVTSGVTDAAGTVARLPLTNVVAGFQRCAVAGNGAPDCGVASVALCQSKGFSTGSSIDITSSRKCPASVWAQGREPTPGECQDESFVSRAMCQ
jgi:hypothetical protein